MPILSWQEGQTIKNVRKMVLSSLFAALTAVCAWISIPLPPLAFTLQSFSLLLCLGLLGGKWGTVTMGLYLCLGILGLPVFSGFQGSAALLGPTGGFLWGFFLGGLVYWCMERLGILPAMIAAQLVCYLCGCGWFSVYAGGSGLTAAVLTCVVPYLVPDALKLGLAYTLTKRIGKRITI